MDKIAPHHAEKKAEKEQEKEQKHEQKQLEKEQKHSGNGRSSYEDPNSQYGSGSGNTAQHLRNPIQHAEGRQQEGQYAGMSGNGSRNEQYPYNDGYGGQSGSDKMRPNEAMDPYSIKGQQAAAAAHHGHRGHEGLDEQSGGRQGGLTGSRDDGYGRNEEYGRGDEFGRGGHSSRENHNAIPTAGGEKLGGGYGDSSDRHHHGRDSDRHHGSDKDHHYGRDAAGAGAVGAGAYEMEKKHHGKHDRHDPMMEGRGQQGQGMPNEPYDQGMGGSDRHRHGHHNGASGMGAGGLSGQQGAGYGQNEMPSQGQPGGGMAGGVPTEKKMGGAYEAGYRDAMQHLQAERQM